MTGTPKGHVSRSDIARLAGVGRSAVTNWKSRHRDFPEAVFVGGAEVFAAAAVGAWLDCRVIPANALRKGEPPGTTYGTRFRSGLVTGTASVELVEKKVPSSVGTAAERAKADLWETLSGDRNLVLGLVCLRAVDPRGWASLVGRGQDAFIERLRSVAPDLPRVFGEVDPGGRRGPDFERMVQAVDRAVSECGGAEVFDFLLDRFSGLEGKRGEFYTPRSLVDVAIEAVAPGTGDRIYDPSCGFGELLAAAAVRAKQSGGTVPPVCGSAWGDYSTLIAKLNLLVHEVDETVSDGVGHALAGLSVKEERFDVVVANPPFNMGLWDGQRESHSRRWPYGPPPPHNANFAWLQHIVMSLRPGGRAAVIMANGAASSENPRERAIRAGLVEDGFVEGLIALPSHLFHATTIPVTIWLLGRPAAGKGEILFVDASNLGVMTDRTHRSLTKEDTDTIERVVTEWRHAVGEYEGVPGLSCSLPIEEVRRQDYILNPRRYVLPSDTSESISRTDRLRELKGRLEKLHVRAAEIDETVEHALRGVGL
ncbi:N-6 DNA methylase [Streptosporangium saharense]|uniref:N-6 DNA methylase n=1 Tax=Streptosporangium saharense TaxID=1706840 RepID=UPI0033274C16